MSGIFGGSSQAAQTPAITGLQIQTSAFGKAMPLVYGMTRIAGNLAWYSDFHTTPGSSGGGGGGKGGVTGGGKGSSSSSPTYTAAVVIALCEGPITGFGQVWSSQTLTSFSSIGLSGFEGGLTQAPWGYLATNYASQCLNYPLIAYAAGVAQLGTSASLPNYNFELQGLLYNSSGNGADADPSQVVTDLLTNSYHGVGFPASRLGSLVTVSETFTIPGSTYAIAVAHAAALQFTCDVEDGSGGTLECVPWNVVPASGQYRNQYATPNGTFVFSAADVGKTVIITYAYLGTLSVYQGYALASGLWISPAYSEQASANTMLDDIAQFTDSEFVWSSGVLTLVPRGTVALSANGYSYTPPAAAEFDLDDDDFMKNQGSTGASAAMSDDPVILTRLRASDQINDITVEYLDRGNAYATAIAEVTDQASIDSTKRHTTSNFTAHLFCQTTAANTSAQLLMQRQFIRNTYGFTLDQRYCLLDPMDLVTLTDPYMGLNKQPVRITEITENDDGSLSIIAEEYPVGLGQAALYNFSAGEGYIADYNVDPGNVNAPIIFEPPPLLAGTPVISVGASGASKWWGGCDVWLSIDGTTYNRVARINSPVRQGVLTANLPAGSDPDTSHTLSIDLIESLASLLSGTQADADDYRTLCYVDGELISYETATLQAGDGYDYALTYLRRGAYGTTIGAHAAGTQFARVDDNIVDISLPLTPISYVGKTIYVKFTSFNIYNSGEQSLAGVSPYTYSPTGATAYVAPPTSCSIATGIEQQPDGTIQPFMTIAWGASPDPLFDKYEVQYRLHTGPGAWQDMNVASNTTSLTIQPIAPNTAYDAQVRAVRTSGPFYSAWAQDLNVTTVGKTTPPPAPTSPSCSGGYRQITLDWVASAENDIAWYEIWESADTVLAHGSRIGLITGTHYVRPGLNLADTRYYWIRAQDTSGNFSAYLGPVGSTTLGIDSADITGQIVGAQIAANTLAASNLISGLDVVQIVASISSANPATSNVAYESSTATLFRWNGTAWISSIGAGDIPAGSIDITKFASGITPVQIVSSLPGTAVEGDTALLTTDGQLYRYHSGAWTVAVPAVNVTGTLADSQIAAISAPKITGTLSDAQIAALSATKITGTLSDAQIAALSASKVTGSLTDSQIAALSAAKLTGQITTTQITPGAVTTPLLAAAAVTTANLAAGAITASKLAIGSSLIVDQYFSDPSYWGLFGGAYYEGDTSTANAMGGNNDVTIPLSVIPANSGLNVGFQTAQHVQVQPNTEYRLSCLAWAYYGDPNKPLIMQAPCYAADGTTLLSDPSVTATNAAPWTATGGAPLELVFTTPPNAAFMNPAVYVNGGGSGAPAGSGYWITAALTLQPTASATLIQDGAISTNKIAANAVTAAQIAAGTITAAQIQAGGITASNIASNTITSAQIAANTITAAQIQAGTITANELAANSVTAGKIAAGSITATDIAANTITSAQIAANTITATQIAAGAITATQIAANTITAANIAANAITTAAISAGAVNATQIAAGAVTASKVYIGDTTNLIIDPGFADPGYWNLDPVAVYYQTSAGGNYVNMPKYVVIAEPSFAASGDYGFSTPQIAVTANENYNLSFNACSVAGPPTFDLVIQASYYDASGAYISSVYATIHGTNALQTGSLDFTPPTNVVSVLCYGYVYASSAGAATGYWCVGNMKLIRRLVGSLIVDGSITATQIAAGTITATQIQAGTIDASKIAAGTITAAQIQAAGITGDRIAGTTITGANIAGLTITAANLAAGTITGDKINANFFQGYSFIANPAGGGSVNYAQMYGGQYTSGGLNYGPYFAVVDGSGNVRFVAGQWAGQYGLHVWNATGTKILDAGDLGVSVVGTSNISTNAVTYPYGVNMTAGNFVLWSHSADVTGTLSFSAYVGVYHAGGAMGSPAGRLKLYINGTAIIWSDAPATFTTGVGVSLGYSVAVNAGDNILIRWEETNASTTDTSGGSLFAVILQR